MSKGQRVMSRRQQGKDLATTPSSKHQILTEVEVNIVYASGSKQYTVEVELNNTVTCNTYNCKWFEKKEDAIACYNMIVAKMKEKNFHLCDLKENGFEFNMLCL